MDLFVIRHRSAWATPEELHGDPRDDGSIVLVAGEAGSARRGRPRTSPACAELFGDLAETARAQPSGGRP